MLIAKLNQRLEQGRQGLGASSCTLYISDPHWSDEYRLVAISGVQKDEMMYGFISPPSARKVIVEGELEVFIPDCFLGRRDDEPPPLPEGLPERVRSLFGDFGQREGVMASARLIHVNDAGERVAILFVNFSTSMEFDDPLKERIRAFFRDTLGDLDETRQELIRQDADWLAEATRIASPNWPGVDPDFGLRETPDAYFDLVIEAVLKALRIPPGTGLGTLHLYNAEENTLYLHGSYGAIKHPSKAQKHLVREIEGVVSWVALMNRALFIRDLESSDFNAIHVWLNEDVKSELAVPLESEGELIGVLCLECTEPQRLLPRHVRSVWYAANKAAVAHMVHQHASMNRKLLELSSQATVGRAGAHTSLKDVACLAKDYLKASYCDIWRYNPDTLQFDNWAASYEDFEPQSRPEGWTQYVQRLKHPLWISDIKGVGQYSLSYWKDDKWYDGAPEGTDPMELNPVVISQGIRSELAIPITMREDCVGVAWVKYRREGLERPKQLLMSFARGFAAEAGLVLDSIQRREVDLKEKSVIDSVGEQIATAIKWRWEQEQSQIVDTVFLSTPYHSRLGGDFYAKKVIDKDTLGVLLVDGEGHGVQGSLHMLPLMTAFESSWQSYSTAHVISQLAKLSKAVGVRGSAIYCIFTLIEKKRWLCVTSAGHESLLLFQNKGRGRWNARNYPDAAGPMFGGLLEEPLIDHRIELFKGDIIVGYTDGFADQRRSERRSERSRYFDATRVASKVLDLLSKQQEDDDTVDISDLAHRLMKESWEQQGNMFLDDATVFIVKVK